MAKDVEVMCVRQALSLRWLLATSRAASNLCVLACSLVALSVCPRGDEDLDARRLQDRAVSTVASVAASATGPRGTLSAASGGYKKTVASRGFLLGDLVLEPLPNYTLSLKNFGEVDTKKL